MQDDKCTCEQVVDTIHNYGLSGEALDAWNNPDQFIERFTFTKEELHAPLYTIIRKNIKTKLETYDYKKYRIVKEEKNNKIEYKIEELDLVHQPCWWRDMFGFNQLWQRPTKMIGEAIRVARITAIREVINKWRQLNAKGFTGNTK